MGVHFAKTVICCAAGGAPISLLASYENVLPLGHPLLAVDRLVAVDGRPAVLVGGL